MTYASYGSQVAGIVFIAGTSTFSLFHHAARLPLLCFGHISTDLAALSCERRLN